MNEANRETPENSIQSESDVLLSVRHLKKYFESTQNVFRHITVKAVDDISFDIRRGETLGIVGESGCGKTTLGRCILRIIEPTSGDIIFDGKRINDVDMTPLRRKMQIVFQDPYASLDPRKSVAGIIGEALDIHRLYKTKEERREKILHLMDLVGLSEKFYNRYPHEFSGGQRQRIGIARALAVSPEFIVCDEPVSALDVSIQAQVINMLENLQEKHHLTYLFIAHDLAVVRHISNRIGVLYLGHLVELADSNELYDNPLHPYTKMLLSAIPIADPDLSAKRKRIKAEGEIPSPINPPSGCPFRTRCREATAECAVSFPELKEVSPGHFAACFRCS
jgi:oligopeptide transport system ATP-binding protein